MKKKQLTTLRYYLTCVSLFIWLFSPLEAFSETVKTFSVGRSPQMITCGPDGNLWFTQRSGTIGKLTPDGSLTSYPVRTDGQNTGPYGICAGPDRNLWFTESFQDTIGRITPSGIVTEFSEGITPKSHLGAITAGPDGNLWFTEPWHTNAELEIVGRIGRITPSGVVTEFSEGISPNSGPNDITTGTDGNLWFAERAGRIGRITPFGVVTEFSEGISPNSDFRGITKGPDGNLWFTNHSGDKIGRITPSGVVTEFSEGITPKSAPYGITTGPDGNLWFTESEPGDAPDPRLRYYKVGRITPSGIVTEFKVGTIDKEPKGITAGPDGNVWFTFSEGYHIGRISDITSDCRASYGANQILHIPHLSFESALETSWLWADFIYQSHPDFPSEALFKLTTYGVLVDPTYPCDPSTLSADLSITIPEVVLQEGITNNWTLEFVPTLSVNGSVYFVLRDDSRISSIP